MACLTRWHTNAQAAALQSHPQRRSRRRDLQVFSEHRQRCGDPAIVRDVLQQGAPLVS